MALLTAGHVCPGDGSVCPGDAGVLSRTPPFRRCGVASVIGASVPLPAVVDPGRPPTLERLATEPVAGRLASSLASLVRAL